MSMRILAAALVALLGGACGSPPKELQAQGGSHVYARLCASCHAPDGKSLATLAPPLSEHAVRLLEKGGRPHLIRVVLNGMAGPIEVGGRRYDAVMTPLRYLKDQQVADVLNFILTSWGNAALLPPDHKAFSPEEVNRERATVLSPRQIAEERPAL